MKKTAIIVAGGSGVRMGSKIPKQFLTVKNKPVLMHTIEKFYTYDPQINLIIVLPESQIAYWKDLVKKYQFDISHQVVCGGQSRFHSVTNGLNAAEREGIIFIHDGVRPLVSHETIERCYQLANEKGAAIPVLPVYESLRRLTNDHNQAVDRNSYVNVQTPQVFKAEVIFDSYDTDFQDWFTDDASVVEAAGMQIHLATGNRENIKLTHPGDLQIAEVLL
ncbi:2-C-methyl-D-erythritol 4-phosphate cytidylyltransferase [Puteibacter caeruleilacunae]|nr:2-C-methyl-D-erythritol 4-phosphate cytidylyltransferase [Puteibacter caeruleilacunae]